MCVGTVIPALGILEEVFDERVRRVFEQLLTVRRQPVLALVKEAVHLVRHRPGVVFDDEAFLRSELSTTASTTTAHDRFGVEVIVAIVLRVHLLDRVRCRGLRRLQDRFVVARRDETGLYHLTVLLPSDK